MLSRRTPMRRTGFKPKGATSFTVRKGSAVGQSTGEDRPRAMPTVDPGRFRLPQPVSGDVVAVAKTTYVRNKTLREAYRLIPCQDCNADDGTVVCAHANEGAHGKGMAIKAGDDRGASLCFTCHSRLDQGSDMTRDERRAFWWAAHIKTIPALVAAGHWPKHIPIPDLTTPSEEEAHA